MVCTYGGVSAVCCAVTDCEIANRAVGLLRKPPAPLSWYTHTALYCKRICNSSPRREMSQSTHGGT